MSAPLKFRPMNGLLNIGRRIVEGLGLAEFWDGDDGLEGVLRDKLRESGVPEKPIALSGQGGMTPRQVAEHAGFIRRRKLRKVK